MLDRTKIGREVRRAGHFHFEEGDFSCQRYYYVSIIQFRFIVSLSSRHHRPYPINFLATWTIRLGPALDSRLRPAWIYLPNLIGCDTVRTMISDLRWKGAVEGRCSMASVYQTKDPTSTAFSLKSPRGVPRKVKLALVCTRDVCTRFWRNVITCL